MDTGNKKPVTFVDVAVALENRTSGAVDFANRVVSHHVHMLPPVEKREGKR
jgi:hypothetical protein